MNSERQLDDQDLHRGARTISSSATDGKESFDPFLWLASMPGHFSDDVMMQKFV